jgi:hypothetical protein
MRRPAGNSKEQCLPGYSFRSFPALVSLLYDRPHRHRTGARLIGRHRLSPTAGEGTIARQHRVRRAELYCGAVLAPPRPLVCAAAILIGRSLSMARVSFSFATWPPLKPHACHLRRDKPASFPDGAVSSHAPASARGVPAENSPPVRSVVQGSSCSPCLTCLARGQLAQLEVGEQSR